NFLALDRAGPIAGAVHVDVDPVAWLDVEVSVSMQVDAAVHDVVLLQVGPVVLTDSSVLVVEIAHDQDRRRIGGRELDADDLFLTGPQCEKRKQEERDEKFPGASHNNLVEMQKPIRPPIACQSAALN